MLKGGAKFLGKQVKQKFPVTPNLLTALTISLPKESPYRSAYNLFFFGLARVGNILPYKVNSFHPLRHLTWKRIQTCSDGVIVSLKVT